MAADNIIELSDAIFEEEVINSDTLVLVDFWAPWCGPCKIISPIVEELANIYTDKLKVGTLNVDENQQTTAKFAIRSIPTLILFKGGEPIDQIIGAVPKSELENFVQKAI